MLLKNIILFFVIFLFIACEVSDDTDIQKEVITELIMKIETDANRKITIPIDDNSTYNFDVSWGDETSSFGLTRGDEELTHTYDKYGTKTIKISGEFPHIYFYKQDDIRGSCPVKIKEIVNWGTIKYKSFEKSFANCKYFKFRYGINPPDLSEVVSLNGTFRSAINFDSDISRWDVSNVTDMNETFLNAVNFNGDISSWDVSNVTNMNNMFVNAMSFNGDISSWDVSNVTNMYRMFDSAMNFNGDLSSWDVSNVTNMNAMFQYASSFNGDISSWDVSSVTNMDNMFYDAKNFSGDISSWDVSSVNSMINMFYGAVNFDNDLSGWDVGNVDKSSHYGFAPHLDEEKYPNFP